jgi:hypothetical protein
VLQQRTEYAAPTPRPVARPVLSSEQLQQSPQLPEGALDLKADMVGVAPSPA